MTDDRRSMLRIALRTGGVTQSELARRTGMSQKHISMVITGRSEGSEELWDRMAFVLGYRWDYRLLRDPQAMEEMARMKGGAHES